MLCPNFYFGKISEINSSNESVLKLLAILDQALKPILIHINRLYIIKK